MQCLYILLTPKSVQYCWIFFHPTFISRYRAERPSYCVKHEDQMAIIVLGRTSHLFVDIRDFDEVWISDDFRIEPFVAHHSQSHCDDAVEHFPHHGHQARFVLRWAML